MRVRGELKKEKMEGVGGGMEEFGGRLGG